MPVPETASEVFDLIFTPSLMDMIVEQSNLFAKQVTGEEKYATWEKITQEEPKAYLGFCILMGIAHLPALDDYWSTTPLFITPQTQIGYQKIASGRSLAISTLWTTPLFHHGDYQGTIAWEKCGQ